MNVGAILELALEAYVQTLQVIGLAESRKYIEAIRRLRKEILAERSLGYDSDDARLEKLYAELAIELQAAQSDLLRFKPGGASGPAEPKH